MIENIYIATWPNGFFGSAGQSWLSLDIEEIKKHLLEFTPNVKCVKYNELLSLRLKENDIVIYSSSDEPNIRAYLKDLMYFVNKKAYIIPSYDSLLAHENKGFQQIKREVEIFGDLSGKYSFDFDLLKSSFPYVYKKTDGAGSSNVHLIHNNMDEKKILKKFYKVDIKRVIIKIQRSFKLTNFEYDLYNYRHKGFNLGVTQDFISNLECDYKVLIFGDKFFVLKRDVRKNDFRASGSGSFSFEQPPVEVLNYAKDIFNILKQPYASLDIALSKVGCHLIEYQILNFGPYTLKSSNGFYEFKDRSWVYIDDKQNLENCFGLALNKYINENYNR